MTLPARQQRALDGMAGALCADDPHLAGMFTIFARLSDGQPVTAEPQSRRRRRNWPRPGQALSMFVLVLIAFALIIVSALFGGARSVKSCVAAPLSRPACQTYAPAAAVKNRPRP
jgi:hypothetical protein